MTPEEEADGWVEVDCPECGNLNRAARRRCAHCNHTGKVIKRP